MLHILLLILKVVGIILAVIAGLAVLLVCLVLFSPLKYRASGSGDGTWESLQAEARCSWLFPLVSGKFIYCKGALAWDVRVAWKHLNANAEYAEEKYSEGDRGAESEDRFQQPEENVPKHEEEVSEQKKTIPEPERMTVKPEREDPGKTQKQSPPKQKQKDKSAQRSKEKTFFENIKYTIQRICDKIKALFEKKEQMMSFIEDKTHQAAWERVKKEASWFFRKIIPSRMSADLKFGFEDPYHTGKALAFLAVVYPFAEGRLSIEPDFEKRTLEGKASLKGKIRLVYLVIPAVKLFFDEHVRRTYRDLKKVWK